MFERTFVLWFWLVTVSAREYQLGFPTRRDSATFRDKGTEVPSLSWDKGTTGHAQNLATGWDGRGQPVKIRDGTITIFLSKSRMGHWTGQSLFLSLYSDNGLRVQNWKFFGFLGKEILSRDVKGQRSLSRDFCSCPCPGTRKYFCPGTKGQQDVPSRIVHSSSSLRD